MPEYWIDTNVFIQAKNGLYALDVAPEFWAFLDSMNEAGRVASSSLVRDELLVGMDELAEWARERGETAMFITRMLKWRSKRWRSMYPRDTRPTKPPCFWRRRLHG